MAPKYVLSSKKVPNIELTIVEVKNTILIEAFSKNELNPTIMIESSRSYCLRYPPFIEITWECKYSFMASKAMKVLFFVIKINNHFLYLINVKFKIFWKIVKCTFLIC